MQVPDIPDNETPRLSVLYDLAVLDTPPEVHFDRITRLACFMFNVPIAVVSMVDVNRQWFKSKQGLSQCETHRDISFCGHAILQRDVFEIPDATLDPRFADNPMVTAEQGIRFYAGVPLLINDLAIGMLCIKDFQARSLNVQQKIALQDLAAIVVAELLVDFKSRENITLRAKQQELLKFARVAEQSSSAVLITDGAGYVQWVNAQFTRMSGYQLVELINRKPGSVLQGPATDQSGHKYIWSFVEDISERKQMERIQNEFVATVNHELRTPLTVINGSLSLLLSGVFAKLPEPVLELLQMASKNTSRLTALVNDLLDLEKILADKMPIDLKPCNMLDEINDALQNHQSYAFKFGVKLKLGTVTEQWVKADPLRLQQVFANLLSNAVKFSPNGETVWVDLERYRNTVRVAVSDKGPGIPYAFRTRIFQKFAQADASDTRQKGGTGLGLAISKQLMQRMEGIIDFISDEGKGTTFFIELPALEKEHIDVK